MKIEIMTYNDEQKLNFNLMLNWINFWWLFDQASVNLICPIIINFFLKIIFKILSKIIIIKKKIYSLRCKKKRIYDFITNFFKNFCFMKISNSLNGKFTVERMRISVKILFILYFYIRYKKNMECYTIFFFKNYETIILTLFNTNFFSVLIFIL